MPQELVCVYLKTTGEPAFLHSVDAAEAVRLGDYVSTPPRGKAPDDDALRRAMQKASGIGVASHPELQTEDERARYRAEANATAAHQEALRQAALQPIIMQPGLTLVPGDLPGGLLTPDRGPEPEVTHTTAAGAHTDTEKPAPATTPRGAEKK